MREEGLTDKMTEKTVAKRILVFTFIEIIYIEKRGEYQSEKNTKRNRGIIRKIC